MRSIDTTDLELTQTPGILVNTFHLWQELDKNILNNFDGIGDFMDFRGGIISDSGGFQVMSVIKSGIMKGKIIDEGVIFYPSKKKKIILTPEKSIEFQMRLKTDMIIVLDDFTDPKANYEEAKESVERTIAWAKRSKAEFVRLSKDHQPYILGVVQGGKFQDLRKYCTQELVKIGFDGLGYGGWPIDEKGTFDLISAQTIADNSPKNYFLYGLGVGKPEDIVACAKLGFNIFDCVLPTRDGRHGRLYVYDAESIDAINIMKPNFYKFNSPNNLACDCLLCTRYSREYLAHLFRIKDFTAGRLATIHNLRFYSILMEKIRETLDRK